jgi:two-component system OmpR family response regulator
MKILVVEDDNKIHDFIVLGLKENQYLTLSAYNGVEALDYLEVEKVDLIILDVMMPRLDGLTFLQTIRRQGNSVPVIILSAKRSVEEKVQGLEFGADDYLEKPFAFAELLARIQVLLRRKLGAAPNVQTEFNFKDLKVDLIKREASLAGVKLELQNKEFQLLEYFIRNPERVITKTMILEKVYDIQFDPGTNVVDVLVYRLRTKLDRKYIQTVRGVGYVLKD